ncbi:hypothetical protein BJ912DRAFT_901458 [Pholiota molesta]|nr:hypothetical protein BJ912DRAFT_901458 [Pholiota molesta]
MSNPAAFPDDFRLVVGPLLIGTVLNAFLYGICLLQFVHYWEHSKMTDTIVIKLLVNWTFWLDTFHTCSLLYMLWVYVVENFNNPQYLLTALWPFSATPIVTSLTSFPIQIYLSWRIRQLSQSKRVFLVLCVLSTGQAAAGIACSASAFTNSNLATYSRLIPFVDAWQILAVVTDLSITFFLWGYLSKSRTGQRRSDNVISRIIYSSIETAAVGAVFCIMDLITFTAFPDTNFHVIFAFPMGRIYTNILLRTLNSRSSLRAEFERTLVIPDIVIDPSSHNASSIDPIAISNRIQDGMQSIDVSVNVFNGADFSSDGPPWQEMQAISTSVLGLKEIDRVHQNAGRV